MVADGHVVGPAVLEYVEGDFEDAGEGWADRECAPYSLHLPILQWTPDGSRTRICP